MSVCWTFLKLTQYWDTKYLYLILEKGDQLVKSLKQFSCLGVDDVNTKTNIESIAVFL